MIIEMFLIDEEKTECPEKRIFIIELSPETKEEEKILRNAKIIHKNQIQVWWGDTLGLYCDDKPICYDGLKMSFKIPTLEKTEKRPWSKERDCKECGEQFLPKIPNQRFCEKHMKGNRVL